MKIYLASPFFQPHERENVQLAANILRDKGIDVYVPMEHKVEDAWSYPNHEWGRLVFENDIRAIKEADVVVCLSYGRDSSAGTNFEVGFAFGICKKVVIVIMEHVHLMSLMIMNGCYASINGLNALRAYDFQTMPQMRNNEIEQK